VIPFGNTTIKAGGRTTTWDTPIPLGPRTILAVGNRRDGELPVAEEHWLALIGVSNRIQMESMQRFLFGPLKGPGDTVPIAR